MNDTERTTALGSLNQIASHYRGAVVDPTDGCDEYTEAQFPHLVPAAQFVGQRGLRYFATLRAPVAEFDASVAVRFKLSAHGTNVGLGR